MKGLLFLLGTVISMFSLFFCTQKTHKEPVLSPFQASNFSWQEDYMGRKCHFFSIPDANFEKKLGKRTLEVFNQAEITFAENHQVRINENILQGFAFETPQNGLLWTWQQEEQPIHVGYFFWEQYGVLYTFNLYLKSIEIKEGGQAQASFTLARKIDEQTEKAETLQALFYLKN
jgi:hypothetical protein